MRRCWLNALAATVNRFTDGIAIRHFVMAITGRRIRAGVRVIRAEILRRTAWSSLALFPVPPSTRWTVSLLPRLTEHAAQLHDALRIIRQRHAVLGLFELELDLPDGDGRRLRSLHCPQSSSRLPASPPERQSGSVDREEGVSKTGNPRLRATLIQLAWLWLRHQPQSALTLWFEERVRRNGGRLKKTTIVALARKLLVALWKYVTAGVVIEGAVMKRT